MPVSAPEVVIENIIQTEMASIISAPNTSIPTILSEFPQEYVDFTIAYLADPEFKVNTIFSFYFNPTQLPAFNIVLSSENEAPTDRQMYLNDAVEAIGSENVMRSGSDWACSIAIIIRAEKARQCIVLYNIIKWVMLKNRKRLEASGIKASRFSGSDLAYSPVEPTFVFNRQLKMDCRIYNTVDTLITPDNSTTINQVISSWPVDVRILPGEEDVLG